MGPPHQPRPPSKKKSGNGCLIALAVAGALAAVTVALIAVGIYRFAGTKEGKMISGLIGDAARLAGEAQSAPGTKEVRALGCEQAMAFGMEKMSTILGRLDASAPPSGTTVVTCQVSVFAQPPDCDLVARTYLAAAGPPARGLIVAVSRSGGRNVCSSLYDPDGTKIRDMESDSTLDLPAGK
jgi:hypothetical protein